MGHPKSGMSVDLLKGTEGSGEAGLIGRGKENNVQQCQVLDPALGSQ